jgi:hypothetical protein
MTEKPPVPASWAKDTAHGLIQGYIGPDHKVIKMESFFAALSSALHDAYERGVAEGLLTK